MLQVCFIGPGSAVRCPSINYVILKIWKNFTGTEQQQKHTKTNWVDISWRAVQLNKKYVFFGMGIFIIKIGRLWYRPIFIIGIIYWYDDIFILRRAPGSEQWEMVYNTEWHYTKRFKIQDSRLFIVIHLSPGIYIQSTLWHHENYFDHAIIVRKNTLWHHDTGTSVVKHIEPTTLDRTEVNW